MNLCLNFYLPRRILFSLLLLASTLWSQYTSAHGGVAFQEDLCVINIDFLQAHFTVFQPETRESDEFCEDIPNVSRSVFVMEYCLLYTSDAADE